MADHKFVYTVSGVTLSEAQQHKVAEAIGVAVAHALAQDAPGTVQTECLMINRIYGGRWIPVADAEAIGVQNVLSDNAGGSGPRTAA
jgi:hypothetical protein